MVSISVIVFVLQFYLDAHGVQPVVETAVVVFRRAQVVDHRACLDDFTAEHWVLVSQALKAQNAVLENTVGAFDHSPGFLVCAVIAPLRCALRVGDGPKEVVAHPETHKSL